MECAGVQPGMVHLLFDLSPNFPHLHDLPHTSEIRLLMQSFDENDQRSEWAWPSMRIGPENFTPQYISEGEMNGTITHEVRVFRDQFPSKGRHRVQARLSIDSIGDEQWSPICSRERNVYSSVGSCESSSGIGGRGGSQLHTSYLIQLT